jgi:hypothetical protein
MFRNQNIAFIPTTLIIYMPQTRHYDATQHATSLYNQLRKSKHNTQIPILKHNQFAIIPPSDIVFYDHTKQSINTHVYIFITKFQIAVWKAN